MNLFKELNVQARIVLIFAMVLLLVIGGGIVNFINLSSLAWALPGLHAPEKLGPDLYGALVRTRLTLALILFTEVLLLLPLGIWLMRTARPPLKKYEDEIPIHNSPNSLSLGGAELGAKPSPGEFGALTNQMAEAARNANKVMAHSTVAIRKGIALSEATCEALEENKKLILKVSQLIENLAVGFPKPNERFH